LSIVTIPIISRYLTPGDYGRLELIATTIEVAGLLFSFGLSDTLFRFCADEKEPQRRRFAAGLLGAALLAALTLGFLLQSGAFAILSLWPAMGDGMALRIGLLAATVTGLIELPLAWMRFRGRLGFFFGLMALRSLAQASASVYAAFAGFGIEGMLAANAAIDVLVATGLVLRQWRETGIRLDPALLRKSFRYGFPLVASALSLFVLGACDRWVIARHVEVSELAFYGLAAKLALSVALFMQPFSASWYARRIAVFSAPDGLEQSARHVSLGFLILTCGAFCAALAGGIFVDLALPAAYARVAVFLPWMIAIAFLNEACSLINVGSYVGQGTGRVMTVNGASAILALAGYLLLVPSFGAAGAIAATLAGQSLRLALFAWNGRHIAPIDYRLPAVVCMASLAAGAVILSPPPAALAASMAWMFAALSLIGAVGAKFGMLSLLGIGGASQDVAR
jgi:O-antigen/teichoic acid export membrane protein